MQSDSPSTTIAALRGSKDLLLYFTAPWCQPCKALGPEIEKFAAAHPSIAVVKINVDVETALVKEWEIRTVPVLIFLPASGAPRQFTGFLTAAELGRRISA
jgi:thioredoxin 1